MVVALMNSWVCVFVGVQLLLNKVLSRISLESGEFLEIP